MNLKEHKELLQKSLTSLNVSSTYLGGDPAYRIHNLNRVSRILKSLSELGLFYEEVNKLLNLEVFKETQDEADVSFSEHSNIEKGIEKIKFAIQSFLNFLILNEIGNEEESLSIKLPEINGFEDLAKVSNDFKLALEVPINDLQEGGTVEIVSAEAGSIWLTVYLGTAAAIALVAKLCWSSAVIRKKIAEAKIWEAQAKTLNIKNEMLQTVLEASKVQQQNILDAEAAAIANNVYNSSDPEVIGRLKLSLKTFAELMDKGAKILPNSKSDVIQNSFPDYNNPLAIESTIRQLIQGDDNNTV